MNDASVHHGADDRGLGTQLMAIADGAVLAAANADGAYIPQHTRSTEIALAFHGAGHAADTLERLLPSIALLEDASEGLQLARTAIRDLDEGRALLVDDGIEPEDLLARGNGSGVADAIATGTSASYFRHAAAGVRAIACMADSAELAATSLEDLFGAITGRSR